MAHSEVKVSSRTHPFKFAAGGVKATAIFIERRAELTLSESYSWVTSDHRSGQVIYNISIYIRKIIFATLFESPITGERNVCFLCLAQIKAWSSRWRQQDYSDDPIVSESILYSIPLFQ